MKKPLSLDYKDIAKSDIALWGKQTQLSLQFFNIGEHCFSLLFIQCLIDIKQTCAEVNHDNGLLNDERYHAIFTACNELLINDHLHNKYANQFPLRIWQTGSGTQTNMNVNEVICTIANRDMDELNNEVGDVQSSGYIHANDHVNQSQSSNDVIPSAMHLIVAKLSHLRLLPSIANLRERLHDKEVEFSSVLMVGRTHLMDALPMPVSAVFSSYCSQLTQAEIAIKQSLCEVYQLAIGGTAVGGGDNAPVHFGTQVALKLANRYLLPFVAADNQFAAVSGQDALVRYSCATKQLASMLFKMANDIKLMASGPNCGFNEWHLPANEAGSSMMPGKVNPTQCEALSMVCLQVFGNDLTVSMAASNGQLQLNTYRPVIIHNSIESINLLSDAMTSFADHCLSALTLNQKQIDKNLLQNFSSITFLNNAIGYDVCAQIVAEASQYDISLAQAAEKLNLYSQAEFELLLHSVLPQKP